MNSFKEMERDLGAALTTGLSGFNPKGPSTLGTSSRSTDSALTDAHDTLVQANAIAARIMDMADRLCGPVPTSVDSDSALIAPPYGELGRLRADMRDTRQAMVFADAALTRIEQELIG